MEIFVRRSPEHNKWLRKNTYCIFILITKVNMWVKVFLDIQLSVDKYDSTMCCGSQYETTSTYNNRTIEITALFNRVVEFID